MRRGKDCTRTYSDVNKDIRFVQVHGEVVDGAAGVFKIRSQETIVPQRNLPSHSQTTRRVGDDIQVVGATPAPVYLKLSPLSSEQYPLLARWASMMRRDMKNTDVSAMSTAWCFKDWTISIPQYIGTSAALDDAMKCYLDCKLAFANPMNTTLLAAQVSKFKAVRSIRLALETNGSSPVQTNILLAVQLLYMVEVGRTSS